MKVKFSPQIRSFWIQVIVAFLQVTFGVLWASILLPIDPYKAFVVILNLFVTIFLIFLGLFLARRKPANAY